MELLRRCGRKRPPARIQLTEGLPCSSATQLYSWDDFNVFRVAVLTNGHPLEVVAMKVIKDLGLITELNLDEEKFRYCWRVSLRLCLWSRELQVEGVMCLKPLAWRHAAKMCSLAGPPMVDDVRVLMAVGEGRWCNLF